eukprot:jgi/Mesvir1/14580/Mv05257-RA.1
MAAILRTPRVWQIVTPCEGCDVIEEFEGACVAETGEHAAVHSGPGAVHQLPKHKLSTHDLRYLASLEEADAAAVAGSPCRVWTPIKPLPGLPASIASAAFRGILVRVAGFDTERSKQYAIIVRENDGHKRAFPVENFTPADVEFTRGWAAQQKAVRSLAARLAAGACMAPAYINGDNAYSGTAEERSLQTMETRHFRFMWGNDAEANGGMWIRDIAMRNRNAEYLEQVWDFFENELGWQMPYADGSRGMLHKTGGRLGLKKRINIYIAGTGLSKHRDGFAWGAEEMLLHPHAMAEGSSVTPHEFTHVMQFHSGGFRNNADVGWFWECHANFASHQFIPSYPPALEVYAERCHYELCSTRFNYGSWPFLQYILEHPRCRDASLCFRIWAENCKNEHDCSTEVPFETLMRLATGSPLFRGPGVALDAEVSAVEAFGDVIGELAAAMASWDFVYGAVYREHLAGSPVPSRQRTLLFPCPDAPGWWRPIYSHAPRQYGINIIDLVPVPGAGWGGSANGGLVEAQLRGLQDGDDAPGWRATLLVINASTGEAVRYSPMWKGVGVVEQPIRIFVRPGERCCLAVAAAPSRFTIQKFRPGYHVRPRFLYEVFLKGCEAARAPPKPRWHADLKEEQRRDGGPARRHANGGGWVGASAHVSPDCWVGPRARVWGRARVEAGARILGRSIIKDEAVVSGPGVVVSGRAIVQGQSRVEAGAKVRGCAVVDARAVLGGNARLLEYVQLLGDGRAEGQAIIKGFGEIHLCKDKPLCGGAVCGEDLEVHLDQCPDAPGPVTGGRLYDYMANEQLKSKDGDMAENHHLYAHYKCAAPRLMLLRDDFADNVGTLRGGAGFAYGQVSVGASGWPGSTAHPSSTGPERVFLSLRGDGQYVLFEGHLFDAEDFTVDCLVRRSSPDGSGVLLDFFGKPEPSSVLNNPMTGRFYIDLGSGMDAGQVWIERQWDVELGGSLGEGGGMSQAGTYSGESPSGLPPAREVVACRSTVSFPVGVWEWLTVSKQEDCMRIFFGQQLAGMCEFDRMVSPGDGGGLHWGYLGRSVEGDCFMGDIADLAIYRKGVQSVQEVVQLRQWRGVTM